MLKVGISDIHCPKNNPNQFLIRFANSKSWDLQPVAGLIGTVP